MTIERVHIVYPHGPSAATPDAIGRELGARLSHEVDVSFHDWAAFEAIRPSPRAALVGHAHPVPMTTFRRSARASGWGRRVLLQPFVTELDQVGFLAGVLPHVEHFVAITGAHWARLLPQSHFAPIAPGFTQLDLGVNAHDFPLVVHETRPPGSRRLLYIGRDVPMKNLGYLEEIARRRPSWKFARIGPPGRDRAGIEQLGPMDFRDPSALEALSSFDMFITVGRADANPTTVLEAMAWGLLPVCTPESGYEGYEGVTNIPLGDPDGAVRILDRLQAMPEQHVADVRAANRRRVEEHFTWDHFTGVVRSALFDPVPPMPPISWNTRVSMVARWWATSLAASNRAGLSDSARALAARLRHR